MSKHLLLLSFIFISSITFSQTLIIKDQTSGETIPFVSLSSENNKRYTTADASGKADLSVFKSTDKIYIRSLGYKTIQSSISDLLPIDEVFMEAGVIDDIYDEMIEANMEFGGEVVFLPKGELEKFNGFGAITRY